MLADLADAAAVRGLVPAAAAFGPLTLLVNNAGRVRAKMKSPRLERARFERTMAVNLTAPLFLAQGLRRAGARGADASIVNIVDQRVFKPTPKFFSYTLSKSALHSGDRRRWRRRWRRNCASTRWRRGRRCRARGRSAAQFAAQAAALPLKRGPSPEDIAAAVLYLAQAKSVTGVTIAVDGGQHLAWRTADSDVAE